MTTKHCLIIHRCWFIEWQSKSHILYICWLLSPLLAYFDTCLFPLIWFRAAKPLDSISYGESNRNNNNQIRKKNPFFLRQHTHTHRQNPVSYITYVCWCVNRHFTRCITFCGLYILKYVLCCFYTLSLFVPFRSRFYLFCIAVYMVTI